MTVGQVTDVDLGGYQAVVTMQIPREDVEPA